MNTKPRISRFHKLIFLDDPYTPETHRSVLRAWYREECGNIVDNLEFLSERMPSELPDWGVKGEVAALLRVKVDSILSPNSLIVMTANLVPGEGFSHWVEELSSNTLYSDRPERLVESNVLILPSAAKTALNFGAVLPDWTSKSYDELASWKGEGIATLPTIPFSIVNSFTLRPWIQGGAPSVPTWGGLVEKAIRLGLCDNECIRRDIERGLIRQSVFIQLKRGDWTGKALSPHMVLFDSLMKTAFFAVPPESLSRLRSSQFLRRMRVTRKHQAQYVRNTLNQKVGLVKRLERFCYRSIENMSFLLLERTRT